MDSDKERVEGVVSSRRKFLGAAGILATGGVSSAIGGDETRDSSSTDVTPKGIRWGMVIDLRKCTGCILVPLLANQRWMSHLVFGMLG